MLYVLGDYGALKMGCCARIETKGTNTLVFFVTQPSCELFVGPCVLPMQLQKS